MSSLQVKKIVGRSHNKRTRGDAKLVDKWAKQMEQQVPKWL